MAEPARPTDVLHRYVLRKGALRKVRQRITSRMRHGTRDPFADVHGLLLEPPSVVLDVGANIGYVAHDLHRAWPTARLLCFEPTEQTFARLTRNVGDLPGVELFKVAVSDSDGTATFQVDNRTHGGGSNSLLDHSAEFAAGNRVDRFAPTEVTTVRLDTFCRQHGVERIDVLKLDIEGAEPLALRGAADLLRRSAIDVILTEVRLVPGYEGGALLHELTAQLAEDGYRPYGIYRFAESAIGQSCFGDAVFLGPMFRRRLVERHGAAACGFVD